MSRINTDITIRESLVEIQNKIARGALKHLNNKLPNTLKDIEASTKRHLFDRLISQPEAVSIRSGTLRFEFGLIDGHTRLLNIIDTWLSGVEVTFTKFRVFSNKITGGIKIRAIRSNYNDVINLDEAILTTEKGEKLPWLTWLLSAGLDLLIADYRVQFGPHGRTGGAMMIPGGNWGVPPKFAGIKDNNFVTRAIEEARRDISMDVVNIIGKAV